MPGTRNAEPGRISAYPVGTTSAGDGSLIPLRLDLQDGGTVSVTGTVKRKGDPVDVPLRRRVRLYNESDRRFVRETWSDAVTGAFVFPDLKAGAVYTAMAYDHENNYRALVIDNIQGAAL